MLTLIVYFYSLLFFMTWIVPGQLDCSCDLPEVDFAKGVNLIYYKCNNETPATMTYPITEPEGLLKVLENKRTIIYIFGFLQYPEHPVVQLITNELCERKEDNVVILDWSKYSGANSTTNSTTNLINLNIIKIYQNSEKIGRLFAECIKKLVNAGLNENEIYLIGFSLGAHISGFPGKCSNVTVARITALDPATNIVDPFMCILKSSDAQWVDLIHTDMGGYGIISIPNMATTEYFANNGTRYQPNCTVTLKMFTPEDFCSHRRALELFVKSIRDPNKYIATKCSNSVSYFLNLCKGNEKSIVGYNASNVEGSFYFKTDYY